MQKTLYIPIDTTLNYEFECPLLVKKYDTLKLKFAIFSLGVLQDLNGQAVDVILHKKDGTTIQKTITDTTLNIATIVLDKNATTFIGEVLGEIVITDAGGQATSNIFKFNVSNSLTEDIEIKSKDDITTIEDMRALIATYKNEISAIGESTQAVEALNNITTYIESNLNELTSKNAAAIKNISDLKIENNRADINIPGLTTLNSTAEEKLEEFRLYDTTELNKRVQENTSQLNDIMYNIDKMFPKESTDTSDSQRIQRAINYLSSMNNVKSGGKLYFPSSKYYIDEPIIIPNNGTCIIGNGTQSNSTHFIATKPISHVFKSNSSCNHGIYFEKFVIDGNSLSNYGIDCIFGECSYIREVLVTSCIESGIKTDGFVPLLLENVSLMSNKYGLEVNGGHTLTVVNISGDNNKHLIKISGNASLHVEILGLKSEASLNGTYNQEDVILIDDCDGLKLAVRGATCLSNGSLYPQGQIPSFNSFVKIKNITNSWSLPSITLDNVYMEKEYKYYIDDIVSSKQITLRDFGRGDMVTYNKKIINTGTYSNGLVLDKLNSGFINNNIYYKCIKLIDANTNTIYVDGTNGNDNNSGLNSNEAVLTLSEALKIIPNPINNNITINIKNMKTLESLNINNYTSNNASSLVFDFNNNNIDYIDIRNCDCNITLNNVVIKNNSSKSSDININKCYKNITINNYIGTTTSENGILVSNCNWILSTNCQISNKTKYMIVAWGGSKINCSGLGGSNNSTGLRANELSSIIHTGDSYTATTLSSTYSGGFITNY